MEQGLYIVVQLAVIIFLAPLVSGIVKKIKALSQKRMGPPLLQVYYDITKLLQKDSVISETTSWIFRITPYICISTVLTAALFVPVVINLTSLHFTGDVILFISLLALGRFFMTLAGLDAGSTFGGMGSSREMMLAILFEPALLVALLTLGLISGSTSIVQMIRHMSLSGLGMWQPVHLLTFLALFIILIAETARIPVDDPATHLELTMIHEAMLLEYSGRNLALMELAAVIKQLIIITVLANVFLPAGIPSGAGNLGVALILALLVYIVKVIGITVVLAVVEVSTVKLRLFSVPNLAALSFILAFLGFFQYFVLGR